jgi:hypothetical protein
MKFYSNIKFYSTIKLPCAYYAQTHSNNIPLPELAVREHVCYNTVTEQQAPSNLMSECFCFRIIDIMLNLLVYL